MDNYAYPNFRIELVRQNGETRRNRYMAIAYARKALYETAIGCVTNLEEYKLARKIKSSKTDKEAHYLLMTSGLLKNDFSNKIKFNLSSSVIYNPRHSIYDTRHQAAAAD